MAKSTRMGGGKMKQRTVVPGGGSMKQAAKQAFPNEGLPSNAVADKQANLFFVGSCVLAAGLVLAGFGAAVVMVVGGFNSQPTNWFSIAGGTVGAVALVFLARAAVWMCIFGAVMYATKAGAWEAQQKLCARAMSLKKLIPGGASTAALLLIQGYISRGQLEDTIALGEEQYALFGNDPKQAQNLAPIYSTLGLAYYMKGEWRNSVTWNDRAIESFGKLMEQFKEKKGFVAKMAGAQGQDWIKQMHIQLAMAHFNNGTNHFNLRNFRGAKENYRAAVDQANLAPEFGEKAELIRVSKEQLSRLKHA